MTRFAKRLSLASVLLLCGVANAFEVDALHSGMSFQEARSVIERFSYSKVEIKENYIGAWDILATGTNRSIYLNFCKGRLVQVQKHLQPRFDYFVRLVDEKRKQLGHPTDAWSEPTDVTSAVESNAIRFLWRDKNDYIVVSYIQFPSNNQLDISHRIKNECWQVP